MKLSSLIRVAVAGIAVLSGTAVLNTTTSANTGKNVAVLNEGPAPAPTCDPGNPNCKMPTMNPW